MEGGLCVRKQEDPEQNEPQRGNWEEPTESIQGTKPTEGLGERRRQKQTDSGHY